MDHPTYLLTYLSTDILTIPPTDWPTSSSTFQSTYLSFNLPTHPPDRLSWCWSWWDLPTNPTPSYVLPLTAEWLMYVQCLDCGIWTCGLCVPADAWCPERAPDPLHRQLHRPTKHVHHHRVLSPRQSTGAVTSLSVHLYPCTPACQPSVPLTTTHQHSIILHHVFIPSQHNTPLQPSLATYTFTTLYHTFILILPHYQLFITLIKPLSPFFQLSVAHC